MQVNRGLTLIFTTKKKKTMDMSTLTNSELSFLTHAPRSDKFSSVHRQKVNT